MQVKLFVNKEEYFTLVYAMELYVATKSEEYDNKPTTLGLAKMVEAQQLLKKLKKENTNGKSEKSPST